MEPDQQFLDYVIKAIVEFPEDVRISRTQDDIGILLSLTVHRDDMGKVIGREGNVAKAIRTVLRSVGMKNNLRVNLKILEPKGFETNRPLSATVQGKNEMDEAMDIVRE